MKIVKGADRLEVHWTARKIVEMMEDGKIKHDIDIQRGYVWKKNEKKSALIKSMILDRAIPPLYFNKIEDVYEVEDGKQRILTIKKFMENGFRLIGLDPIPVVNDNGEVEEYDINGLKFSELLDCFQDAIKEYSFVISFTDNADAEEVADTFFNLNNGQTLNSATMNRVKAKSKDKIIGLGKHKLFTECLSEVAMEGHVNDDIVGKVHAVINSEEPCMNAAWIRKYLMEVDIKDSEEEDIEMVANTADVSLEDAKDKVEN